MQLIQLVSFYFLYILPLIEKIAFLFYPNIYYPCLGRHLTVHWTAKKPKAVPKLK